VAIGVHSSVVLGAVLAALAFYGTVHWRESDNAAVAQAQARVQTLQAQLRDVQRDADPHGMAQGSEPTRQHQQWLTELSAAEQAKQVRDDLLSLLALSRPGLSWQGMQLDGQGVWQLQLRADNPRSLELWRQQIKAAGLDGMQWLQMARSSPAVVGKDAAPVAQEPQVLVLTLRAPLGSLSSQPASAGDAL
jgi:hypothetical protein